MAGFFSDVLDYTFNTLQYCTTNFRVNNVFHSALLCATHVASNTKPISADLQSPLTLPQQHTRPPPEVWPHTPFTTNNTQILNALSDPVVFAGVNWPAHGKTMVPEGLQYQSIRQIVSQIKDLGANVVRLTYATEMVDDLYAREGVDVSLPETLVRGLGHEDGKRMYREIVMRNPEFGNWRTTRFDVLDAVAEELANQHIYVHLDNHISKAGWCCSLYDGNGWFNDTYFSPRNWTRGLNFMSHRARHSPKWRGLTSLSLRNELRDTPNNPVAHATYNWSTWYDYLIPAAETLHAVNPDPLIFISGLDFDTNLGPAVRAENLNSPATNQIRPDTFNKQWAEGQNRNVEEVEFKTDSVPIDSNLDARPAKISQDKSGHNRPKTHNPLKSIKLKGEQIKQQHQQHQHQQGQKSSNSTQSRKTFNLTSLPYHNKLVFELHTYRLDITNCTAFKNDLRKAGYGAMLPSATSSLSLSNDTNPSPLNIAPVVLSEFGFPQDNTTYTRPYAQCLKSFLTEIGGGWMYWVLAGSYYERSGILDYDETWGLLKKDWSGWRSQGDIDTYFKPFVKDTLAV